jgi:acetate kinase
MTDINAECLIDFLQNKVVLFKDFPPLKLEELVNGSQVTTFEANEAIIKFGEEGWFIGVLLEGIAKAAYTDDSGQMHQLGTIKPGDFFGEMAVMTGDKRMADIIGVMRCKALLIPQALFSTLLLVHPPAVRYLSKIITERLRQLVMGDTRDDLQSSAIKKSEDPYGFKLHGDKPEKLLVINCDLSSLSYHLYDTVDERNDIGGVIERIGDEGTSHTWRVRGETLSCGLPKGTHRDAFSTLVAQLQASVPSGLSGVTAVGHRVVHGGEKFDGPVIITDEVVDQIQELARFAPRHNPVNLIGIGEARRLFPQAPQVAVFETAFHHTLPSYAYLYGLPYEYYERDRVRRYGFHGLSHAYVSLKAAQFLKRPYNELEIISCHLGHDASICAVDHGRSVDTSMGLTPAEGLISGTRCGDIDPAALLHVMATENLDRDDLDKIINRLGGLQGLSGVSHDLREIEAAGREGNHQALLAFKTFCYRIRKYIGAYVAVMGGLDAIVFTGGIGQGSAGVRSMSCQGLRRMGVVIDEGKNRAARELGRECDIAAEESPVRVLVIPTDEERMIARETLRTLSSHFIDAIIHQHEKVPIPIEVSAHHVHLCQAHVEALFGPGHQLTPETALSQPGQFTCKETVNLVGPRGWVDRVRVIGPARKVTQIEIAMTEQFRLGILPPIRESGDIEQSPGITLEGPAGTVSLDKGVICALRHIHLSPEDALQFGLRDQHRVRVKVEGDRELIFGDVRVRVHPDFRLAMHIDTDEANAANIGVGAVGYIDGIQS